MTEMPLEFEAEPFNGGATVSWDPPEPSALTLVGYKIRASRLDAVRHYDFDRLTTSAVLGGLTNVEVPSDGGDEGGPVDVDLSEDFEGGSDGDAVTADNSIFGDPSFPTPVFSSEQAHSGALSMYSSSDSGPFASLQLPGGGFSGHDFDQPASGEFWFRYASTAPIPSSGSADIFTIMNLQDGSETAPAAVLFSFFTDFPEIVWYDESIEGGLTQDLPDLPQDTWLRCAWSVTPGTPSAASLSVLDSDDTVLYSVTDRPVNGTQFAYVEYGVTNMSTPDYPGDFHLWFDDVQISYTFISEGDTELGDPWELELTAVYTTSTHATVESDPAVVEVSPTADLDDLPYGPDGLPPMQSAPVIPDPPHLDVVDEGDASLRPWWTPAAFDGGSPILSWEITLDDGAGTVTQTAVSNPLARAGVVAGLTNDTTYQVLIRAINAQGASAFSNSLDATPRAGLIAFHPDVEPAPAEEPEIQPPAIYAFFPDKVHGSEGYFSPDNWAGR